MASLENPAQVFKLAYDLVSTSRTLALASNEDNSHWQVIAKDIILCEAKLTDSKLHITIHVVQGIPTNKFTTQFLNAFNARLTGISLGRNENPIFRLHFPIVPSEAFVFSVTQHTTRAPMQVDPALEIILNGHSAGSVAFANLPSAAKRIVALEEALALAEARIQALENKVSRLC